MDINFDKKIEPIIIGCYNGNRDFQRELYNILAPYMYTICINNCTNTRDAEPILVEGFIELFRKIKEYSFRQSFLEWARSFFVTAAKKRCKH